MQNQSLWTIFPIEENGISVTEVRVSKYEKRRVYYGCLAVDPSIFGPSIKRPKTPFSSDFGCGFGCNCVECSGNTANAVLQPTQMMQTDKNICSFNR